LAFPVAGSEGLGGDEETHQALGVDDEAHQALGVDDEAHQDLAHQVLDGDDDVQHIVASVVSNMNKHLKRAWPGVS